MDPKQGVKDNKAYPTQQEITETLKNFAQNFQSDGFLVFTKSNGVNFIGRILVNYKGLTVIKFRKSQLHQSEFSALNFKSICQNRIQKKQELFQQLQKYFPSSSFCIIQGGIYKSCGQISAYTKGTTSVFIY